MEPCTWMQKLGNSVGNLWTHERFPPILRVTAFLRICIGAGSYFGLVRQIGNGALFPLVYWIPKFYWLVPNSFAPYSRLKECVTVAVSRPLNVPCLFWTAFSEIPFLLTERYAEGHRIPILCKTWLDSLLHPRSRSFTIDFVTVTQKAFLPKDHCFTDSVHTL